MFAWAGIQILRKYSFGVKLKNITLQLGLVVNYFTGSFKIFHNWKKTEKIQINFMNKEWKFWICFY